MRKNKATKYALDWVVKAALSYTDEALGLRTALRIAPVAQVARCAAEDERWSQFMHLMTNSLKLRRSLISRWEQVIANRPSKFEFARRGVAIARSIDASVAARQALLQIECHDR